MGILMWGRLQLRNWPSRRREPSETAWGGYSGLWGSDLQLIQGPWSRRAFSCIGDAEFVSYDALVWGIGLHTRHPTTDEHRLKDSSYTTDRLQLCIFPYLGRSVVDF